MPKRIDALTAEQKARIPEWVQKWIAIGLSTDPTDWARFERGARAAYRFAKLDQPKVVVHVGSPLVLALAAPIAGYLLDNRPWERQVSPRGALRRRAGSLLAVGGAVDDAVHGAVRGAVDGAVGGAVDDAVRGAVHGAVHAYVRNNWYRLIGGQFWVGWGGFASSWYYWASPSYVSFFTDVCKLELDKQILAAAQAYRDAAESACWWWPHREFVMVSARPSEIHRDDRGRLHNEFGPAIAWGDGYGIWSHHGTRVPREVIEAPQTLTAQRITTEQNAEVRRVMVERFGAERYLREAGAKQLHKDDWGTLWRAELPGDEPLVMVEVINSTAEPDGHFKTYYLRVPPVMATARQAVAWTFGMDRADEYDPAVMS